MESEKEVLVRVLDDWEVPPRTPKKAQIVSRSLETILKREAFLSLKPRKKNLREPSLASPVETRSSYKLDVGTKARKGLRIEKQTREEETRRCLENGCERTIQEFSKIGK